MNPELALRLPQPDPDKWISWTLAVVVHALLAAVLFFGVQWQTQPVESVAVELYRDVPAAAVVRPVAPPELTPPPPEPKPEPKPEPAKPDIAIKNTEKPKAKPEPKPVPKPPVQDWSKELKATEQNLSQNKATQAADRELKDMQAAARGRSSRSWADRIAAKVRGNILVPPGITGNPVAEFDISLLPGGDVLNARLRKSSGNASLDAAIERAIRKSSPLPLPEDSSVFQRELHVILKPLENQ